MKVAFDLNGHSLSAKTTEATALLDTYLGAQIEAQAAALLDTYLGAESKPVSRRRTKPSLRSMC